MDIFAPCTFVEKWYLKINFFWDSNFWELSDTSDTLLICSFLSLFDFLGPYRDITVKGRATIMDSIDKLGFKRDEKLYIRPVYQRDRERILQEFEGDVNKSHVVLDGNHRLDWMLHNQKLPGATSIAQVTNLKGKVCRVTIVSKADLECR